MKKLLLVLVLVGFGVTVFAQKTAYVHQDSVYAMMPEMQNAKTQLNDYLTQVQAEIDGMQLDYQQKVQDFNDNVNTFSELIKNNKVSEIQALEKRIQDFQTLAQTEYVEKQAELVIPIIEKFDEAVESVRKSMKFDVVLNVGGAVIYVNPKYIITDEVLTELGIN